MNVIPAPLCVILGLDPGIHFAVIHEWFIGVRPGSDPIPSIVKIC